VEKIRRDVAAAAAMMKAILTALLSVDEEE